MRRGSDLSVKIEKTQFPSTGIGMQKIRKYM